MKAMLSKQVGGPDTLVLEELPDPKPGAGEVLHCRSRPAG